MDGIISPVYPTLAVPHDGIKWWGYTSHWNLLDLPAVVFPVGERFNLKPLINGNHPVSDLGPARNPIEREVMEQWKPETYNGAPIALQLVGRRHNEEKVLAMLQVIEYARSQT